MKYHVTSDIISISSHKMASPRISVTFPGPPPWIVAIVAHLPWVETWSRCARFANQWVMPQQSMLYSQPWASISMRFLGPGDPRGPVDRCGWRSDPLRC